MYLYSEFKTNSDSSPFFNSITTLIPSLSDSSLKSDIPTIFFSFTKLAIFSIKEALFNWYGISFIIKLSLPFFPSSISIFPLTLTLPLPVV